jgi:hypothetical protein
MQTTNTFLYRYIGLILFLFLVFLPLSTAFARDEVTDRNPTAGGTKSTNSNNGGGGKSGTKNVSYAWSWSVDVYKFADGTLAGYANYREGNFVAGGERREGNNERQNNGGGGSNCRNNNNLCIVTPYTPPEVFPPPTDPNNPGGGGGGGTSDPNAPVVSLYIQKQGGTTWTKTVDIIEGEEVALRWETTNTNYCQSTDTTEFTVGNTNGSAGTTNTVAEPALGQRVYGISCTGQRGGTAQSTAGVTVLRTPLTLTANPSIVRRDEVSDLTWDVGSRTGCTLQRRGDTTATPITSQTGTIDSTTIRGETLYTLTCGTESATALIKMLPVISET